MKKSILNIGIALNKAEQLHIHGGDGEICGEGDCRSGHCCDGVCLPVELVCFPTPVGGGGQGSGDE